MDFWLNVSIGILLRDVHDQMHFWSIVEMCIEI
jgi:hypothetical protein